MKILLIIYDLILCLCVPFYLIGLALKGKWRPLMSERFSIVSQDVRQQLRKKEVIWLHAVSLGEVSTCKFLIRHLSDLYPKKTILITTVTHTGRKLAQSLRQENIVVLYIPFDLGFLMSSFIKKVNPKLLILVETELWPNLLYQAENKAIPVVVINARFSDRSFKKYLFFKWFIRYLSRGIEYFCAQSEIERDRLLLLGISEDKIRITGNMKFDAIEELSQEQLSVIFSLKEKIRLQDKETLIVAGSTHKPEEENILEAFIELKKKFPNLRLLIAPRHLERLNEIEKIIANKNFKFYRLSREDACEDDSILLLDAIGQLHLIYSIASIIFVGGSLAQIGGHNILEAAYFKKPILVGPYMHNFRAITKYFLSNQGIIQLRCREELVEAMDSLLSDRSKLSELASRAKSLLLAKQGATLKNLDIINKYLS